MNDCKTTDCKTTDCKPTDFLTNNQLPDLETIPPKSIVKTHSQSNCETLFRIQSFVNTLSTEFHIDILRIIHKYASESINENNNGCFINISVLSDECISDILKYINFSTSRDDTITRIEKKMGKLESDFFSN